jgi:arylsulfatase A-like enzyme
MNLKSLAIALTSLLAVCFLTHSSQAADQAASPAKPNIVIIYTDDVGYGDVGCYGAGGIPTPAIDQLAKSGLRFTDAHASAATCTPSRYSLLTGQYAFRNKRAEILPGDAPLLIEPGSVTLPSLLREAGYTTACIGKWHLGLGNGDIDWNGEIKPGPMEVGFDTCYLLPATNDRVPCVYIDEHRVENLNPDDPITVNYQKQVGDLPTGMSHPQTLRYPADEQHSNTIINGISRIGYMSGGKAAWWVDEEMCDVFTGKAIEFIESQQDRPFFLFFSLHQPHVPRLPNPRFIGQSKHGRRGDAIVEADWMVSEIMKTLDRLKLRENTLVIFSSDNGPVIDDGYSDGAMESVGDHKPSGPFRGGKYQAWEGGTRLPTIVSWPNRIKPGESDALICQVDFLASIAALTGAKIPAGAAVDSKNTLPALMGESKIGREILLEQSTQAISIRKGQWKYIPPGKRPSFAEMKHSHADDPTNSPPLSTRAYLFDLSKDPGELNNLIKEHPDVAQELADLLKQIRKEPRFSQH